MSPRLLTKLAQAWEAAPSTPFGALLEGVEEVAWDLLPQRSCSMRLCNMSDQLFEQGLDAWIAGKRVVVTTEGWKS